MHVVFIEPSFPANQREFVRALKHVGATVTGIGERPKASLDSDLQHWLAHYEEVPNVCDQPRLIEIVRWLAEKLPVDRIEATVEAHILPVAKAREACGVPGTSVRTAFLCRDKPAMKDVLRDGGVPCAQSLGTDSADQVEAFAADVGYPLVVKPPDGAGASGTYRVTSDTELHSALEAAGVGQGAQVAVEEFNEGHEAFYDTISVGGRPLHDFVSHYYPNVLEAMRARWISPQFIATNRIDSAPDYQEVRALGLKVAELLGIETSATHMEWFFGDKGLRFSEIGCRPPGVRAWDVYNAANDIDLYEEWAMAVVHGVAQRQASRRFAAGLIALRPTQDGTIRGYEGMAAVESRFGQWIIDLHLPPAGTPTQPVEAGYMANAWVRMRHPDYDELRRMLTVVGETVKVIAD